MVFCTVEATTRDAFALIDTLETTVERPHIVDSSSSIRVNKKEPLPATVASLPLFFEFARAADCDWCC